MTPELFQKISTCADSIVQVETADRARRTRDRVSGTSQYDGGPVVFLDQAGSNDPDHALVPARMKQDGGFSGAKNRVAINHGKSLTGNITIVFPPEIIRSEEHTSELQSLKRNSYAVFCLKTKKGNNN